MLLMMLCTGSGVLAADKTVPVVIREAESRLDQVRRDLAVARSELSAARARTDQSREKLQRTAILAPFDGVVTERFIQAGEWADAGAAVVRLVDTAELEAQAWVPVVMLAHLREGMELKFTANGSRGTGSVRTLVPVGDRQSRLYEVRLVIDDGDWSPGQSVRLTVPTAAARTVTVVPRDALVVRRDAISVFRVTNDNLAEQLQVETGIADGDYIEVTGDLQAGDRIVIRGSERLRNGQSVTPSETLPGN
jgi:RND family efflux transporter MFP subunit